MFGPDSKGGKDAHRLASDEKRRRRNAERLAVSIAGELADIEKLQKDIASVTGILSTTNEVGPLNPKKGSNTAGAAFGEYIEVLMELIHSSSEGIYSTRLKHIAKIELKKMKPLRDDWTSIQQSNNLALVRRAIAQSYQNIASALQSEYQSLEKQEHDISEILRS